MYMTMMIKHLQSIDTIWQFDLTAALKLTGQYNSVLILQCDLHVCNMYMPVFDYRLHIYSIDLHMTYMHVHTNIHMYANKSCNI